MSKTGWWGDKVIICLSSHDERRHKNWCLHYKRTDKLCVKTGLQCMGSAHCNFYDCQAGVGPLKQEDKKSIPQGVPVIVDNPNCPPEILRTENDRLRLNARVCVVGHYATYGDKLCGEVVLVKRPGMKYAIGQILDQGNETFVAELDDGKKLTFMKKEAIRNKAFWVLDTYGE